MSNHLETTKRRRNAPLLWAGGAVAAVVLVLGVSGTLSSWTQAMITNDTNTTSATDAVALSESSGGTTCVDTATTATNTATCSTINKYGGTATPLGQGDVKTTSVTLTNTGTGSGALTLDAGACTKSGGAAGSTGNICDEVTVTVACPTGTVKVPTSTLTAFDAAAPAAIGTLTAGASVTCDVTVALPSTAPSSVAGQTASQPLVWTLDAA